MCARSRHIAARLDCFLIHNNVLLQNSSIKFYILASITLNYKPMSLHIQSLQNYGPLPFRYNPQWLQSKSLIDPICSTWRIHLSSTLVYIWQKKLILVKQALRHWEKSLLTSLIEEKRLIKRKLDELQKRYEAVEVNFQTQKAEIEFQCKYHQALKREEEYWILKYRILWIQEGDKSTNFFHIQAKFWQTKNNFRKII